MTHLHHTTDRTASPWAALALAACTLALAAGPVQAGSHPASADLEVQLDAPSTVPIGRPTLYSMTVTNRAGQTSSGITARVTLPLTHTSPQVYILGTASPSDSRCSIVANALVCNLAGLRKGWSTSVSFLYTAPVSSQPLVLTASATSTTTDPNPANNSDSVTPNLVYPARPITASPITTRLCTGTTLTAFEECTHFPSSILSFQAQLLADQTITFGAPGYSGLWSQNPARTSLKMELFEDPGTGPVKVSEFNGWAVNDRNCFEGLTTHVGSSYVSPYEVCMP